MDEKTLIEIVKTLPDDKLQLLIDMMKIMQKEPELATWLIDHKELTINHDLNYCIELARKEVI